ncbi:MAG: sulfotransferase family protein [Rhodanobacteraceae bacterium]
MARYYVRRARRRWREYTATRRMLPDFIIAGAPKCGTTAIYWYLLSHPQIIAPSPPGFEVAYFDEHYRHGLDFYRASFPFVTTVRRRSKRLGGATVITGEHTPAYLTHPLAATRIAQALPDVRIIILLRDPVDRAYSCYQHQLRCGQETLGFREALAAEKQRITGEVERLRSQLDYLSIEYGRHAYVDHGEYLPKVERFFNCIDHDRIMVIKSENLFAHTQRTLDDVTDFLHLEPFKVGDVKPINAGSYDSLDEADPELANKLREHFKPHNEALYSYLDMDFGW